MGGVISSGAVVFGKEPAKNEEVVSSMLRGSIISGMTLFCVNIIRSGRRSARACTTDAPAAAAGAAADDDSAPCSAPAADSRAWIP